MYSSYDHLFSLGRLNPPGARWAELARHPKSDENTTISWRSSAAPRLFAVQPTSPIVPVSSSVSASTPIVDVLSLLILVHFSVALWSDTIFLIHHTGALLPSPAPPATPSPNTAKLSPSPSSEDSVVSLPVPPSVASPSAPGPATPSGAAASPASPSVVSDSATPLSASPSAGALKQIAFAKSPH